MRKYVIENVNPERNGHYYDTRRPPVPLTSKTQASWLQGDYVVSTLSTTNDLYEATHYLTREDADSTKTRLIDRFAVDGEQFTTYGYRYPDNLGRKQYSDVQPMYHVIEIEISVERVA